jgi:hypothetical protein
MCLLVLGFALAAWSFVEVDRPFATVQTTGSLQLVNAGQVSPCDLHGVNPAEMVGGLGTGTLKKFNTAGEMLSFFGRTFYNRGYLDGMNALLLTYPLSCWFARVFARGNGLAEIDAACAEKALFVVDHQHGITPVLDMPTERFRAGMLCDRSNLRALAIWYGS